MIMFQFQYLNIFTHGKVSLLCSPRQGLIPSGKMPLKVECSLKGFISISVAQNKNVILFK